MNSTCQHVSDWIWKFSSTCSPWPWQQDGTPSTGQWTPLISQFIELTDAATQWLVQHKLAWWQTAQSPRSYFTIYLSVTFITDSFSINPAIVIVYKTLHCAKARGVVNSTYTAKALQDISSTLPITSLTGQQWISGFCSSFVQGFSPLPRSFCAAPGWLWKGFCSRPLHLLLSQRHWFRRNPLLLLLSAR